jgi:hypothetical protein
VLSRSAWLASPSANITIVGLSSSAVQLIVSSHPVLFSQHPRWPVIIVLHVSCSHLSPASIYIVGLSSSCCSTCREQPSSLIQPTSTVGPSSSCYTFLVASLLQPASLACYHPAVSLIVSIHSTLPTPIVGQPPFRYSSLVASLQPALPST